MRILVLDDDEKRLIIFKKKLIGKNVECYCTVSEIIKKLKDETWDYLFLDHDLGGKVYVESGGKEETGWDVAVWLSKNIDRQPENIIIHSFNSAGAQNMKSLLPKALVLPGAWNALQ
jgi:hypothetical protein